MENESIGRRIKNVNSLVEKAEEIWMSEVDIRIAGNAVEPLIDICRKLAGIVTEQQRQIEKLQADREAQ